MSVTKYSELIQKPKFEEKNREEHIQENSHAFIEDELWRQSGMGEAFTEEAQKPLLFDEAIEEVEIANQEDIIEEEGIDLESVAIIQDYSKYEEAKVIKMSRQFHIPSAQAVIMRSQLINSMELTQKKREELLTDSQQDLETIVSEYVSAKEKNRIAKETKGHLEQFWKLREALSKDPVLNTEEKARMLYNFAKAYAADVAVFHDMYERGKVTKKRERNIEEYIQRFEGLMEYFDKRDSGQEANGALLTVLGLRKGSAHEEMFQGDLEILEKAKTRARRMDDHAGQKELLSDLSLRDTASRMAVRKEMDSSLSKEQLQGVSRMDSWLIDAGTKSVKRLPFINTIMSMSARERLFIYRLIEEDHLESPTMEDITVSQSSYLPDVSTVNKKMRRIPYRLWEKSGKEGLVRHHWEKLEAAVQIVKQPDVISAIQGYADAFSEEKKIQEKLDENDPEYREYADIRDLTKERDAKLDESLQICQEYEQALKKAEDAWIHKAKKDEEAKKKGEAVQKILSELEELNTQLDEKLTAKGLLDSAKMKKEIEDDAQKASVTSKYKETGSAKAYGMYTSGQALGLMAKSGSVTALMTPIITNALKSAKMAGDTGKIASIGKGLDAANYTSGALITAKGLHTLVASFGAIKKTKAAIETGDIAKADALLMSAQATYSLGAGLTTTMIGLKNLEFAHKTTQLMMGATEVKGAIDAMKAGVKKANIAVAATGLALNSADILVQGVHGVQHIKADMMICELESKNILKGDDATYMEGLTKLEHDNKTRRAMGTLFSTVTNAGTLASCFAGPAGALAWGGIALGLSMGQKLTDYLMKDGTQKKTAEGFFNLLDIEDLIQDDEALKEIPEGLESDMQAEANRRAYKKRALRDLAESKEAQTRLKESLLIHMSAELGFTSFKSLFKHIITKYSIFLHTNLFYHDGVAITEGHENDHPMAVASAELVKSMGLKVVYPVSRDEKAAMKQRHPSIQMIAQKLGA